MPKKPEINLDEALSQAIFTLQNKYDEYKRLVIKDIQMTVIDENGVGQYFAGHEKRMEDILKLAEEISRMKKVIKGIKEEKDGRRDDDHGNNKDASAGGV